MILCILFIFNIPWILNKTQGKIEYWSLAITETIYTIYMELNITLKAYLSIDPISFRTPITQYFLAKYVDISATSLQVSIWCGQFCYLYVHNWCRLGLHMCMYNCMYESPSQVSQLYLVANVCRDIDILEVFQSVLQDSLGTSAPVARMWSGWRTTKSLSSFCTVNWLKEKP